MPSHRDPVLKWLDANTHELPKTGKVLEIGCGNSMDFRDWFLAHGYEWEGLSPEINDANLKIKPGKVESDLSAEEEYDIIFSCHCMEHVERLVEGLRACKKALKPTGIYIQATPIYCQSQILSGNSDWDHINVLTALQWQKHMKFAGFVQGAHWQTGEHDREDSIITCARKV